MTQPQDNLHHCFHNPKRTDLSVFRRDAEYRAKKDNRSTIIHLHAKDDTKWPSCRELFEHEYFYSEVDLAKGQ